MFGQDAMISMAVKAVKKITDDKGGKLTINIKDAQDWLSKNHPDYELVMTANELTLKKK